MGIIRKMIHDAITTHLVMAARLLVAEVNETTGEMSPEYKDALEHIHAATHLIDKEETVEN